MVLWKQEGGVKTMQNNDYISREAVLRALCDASTPVIADNGKPTFQVDYVEAVNRAPAADVRPVVRGEWIRFPESMKYQNVYDADFIVCSCCEEPFNVMDNDCERFMFCPNCGTDMRSVYKPGSKEAWQSLEKAQEDFRKTAQVIAECMRGDVE